jgi:hypothetical protein
MGVATEPASDPGPLLYDLARGPIESQERDLDEIRQRTATVGTFGVAATGLLGAFVLDKHPHAVLGLVALGFFVPAVFALGSAHPTTPFGGWYGLRKGYRGRFGMYLPPLLEALGLPELTHDARNNEMRAAS